MDFALVPARFSDLPGWAEDDPRPLFAAMEACRTHVRTVKPYRTGSVGIEAAELANAFAKARQSDLASAASARAFFEREFSPLRVVRRDGAVGLVTAFYEPEVAVSDRPDEIWRHPFYRRPADLVALDDANRPADLDPSYAFGHLRPDGSIGPYADRGAIDRGHLAGRGLEIAWAADRIDVFFAHVQGAARLRFRDGRSIRITYDGKAGHPFSAIGKWLVDHGEIPLAEISMQSIRAWLAAHPDRQDEILWTNRSYIFFRQADVDDPDSGPIAAAKVPLVAGRSLAVDRLIHTFSTPFYISSPGLRHLDGGRPFNRLMLALDTGTAIVGPSRGDIFTGSGFAAGELAGTVRNEADFVLLAPLEAAGRLVR